MSHPTVTLLDGRSFPLIGLGTYANALSGDRAELGNAVYEAIKVGYRHIDTAWLYVSEEAVGQGVRKAVDEGICKREDVFVTTKIWPTNFTHDRLLEQAKESNQLLGLGYIDLLLLHFPVPFQKIDHPSVTFPVDENKKPLYEDVDIFAETYKALEEVKDLGIAKSIGVSNFSIEQIEKILSSCKHKPVVNQVECTPLLPQRELLDYCTEKGIFLTAYSPLGGGPKFVDGKPVEKDTASILKNDPIINEIAKKYNKSVPQILFKFQTDRRISVIPKSVNKQRIFENQDIFGFTLTKEELNQIESLGRNLRSCAFGDFVDHPNHPFPK